MTEIHGQVTTRQRISGNITATTAIQGELSNDVTNRNIRDYNLLRNKPSIEGVELQGNKTLEDLGITRVYYGTVEYFNNHPSLRSEEGAIYIYWDHQKDENDNNIPGFKVGDGNAYVIDMPFSDDLYIKHILDMTIHVTQEDKDSWNNKVTCFINPLDSENIIFTKN